MIVFTFPLLFAEEDDIYIDEYKATLYPNGTLVEEFTYEILVKKYTMLYRYWVSPLTTNSFNQPYIELIENKAVLGAIGYYKDFTGQVVVHEPYENDISLINAIDSLAYSNEVGSYKSDYFDPGQYSVQYTFDIHPPLEYDEEVGHLNLMLANEHLEYKNVEIVLVDATYIQEVYPHPPSMRIEKQGGDIILTGRSEEDSLLEVEMLIELDAIEKMDGFPKLMEDVRTKTELANPNAQAHFEIVVVDVDDDKLSNVEIRTSSRPGGQSALEGTTDFDGYLFFGDIAPGDYTFSASKDGYVSGTVSGKVFSGKTKSVIISLEKESSGGIPGFPMQSLVLGIVLVSVFIWMSARPHTHKFYRKFNVISFD